MPIERFWPEVNARVNYPLKEVLVDMDNNEVIDMDDNIHKFCVSQVTCLIASYGLQQVVHSWNEHPIPGNAFSDF